ncbi:hypothetical protein RhiirA4_470810 [Rhizophagus irregularis]|uniref:Uncharacterized protein n=1 Tax=Rhizophagus irregularis TaxID=588596 RepID=A0A2I1H1Y8_9GLOM|nr:hypothetical protein RhiirA4_470810 [Rhizophagus irregularis]
MPRFPVKFNRLGQKLMHLPMTDYIKNLHANIPTTQTTTQTNFDDNLSFNEHYFANHAVGDYTHVTSPRQRVDFNNNISQQILERETRPDLYSGNTNSFNENIAMKTQGVSVTNNQTNFNSLHHQNCIEQQVVLNNFPQYYIPESKEILKISDNSSFNGRY